MFAIKVSAVKMVSHENLTEIWSVSRESVCYNEKTPLRHVRYREVRLIIIKMVKPLPEGNKFLREEISLKENSAKFICPNLFTILTFKFRKIYSHWPYHIEGLFL